LPAVHATIASRIDPELNQRSIAAYLFRAYVLGPFSARFRPRQIGRPAHEPTPMAHEVEAAA
jgi:hypothetical protein